MACSLGGGKKRCVGYCRLHKCNITITQMKNRECLKKGCGALKRLPHPYWEQREHRKQIKKANKERRRQNDGV